jgi:hypothetical protein
VSTSSKPESAGSSRNLIIAAVVVAVLLVGYCATRVASSARSIVTAAAGIASRMDTTHHVAAGSAVYLGDTKVADIIKVVVIHADTSTPASPARSKMDSTIQAGLRQETVVYSTSAPATPDLASQLGDAQQVTGQIEGTYDDPSPVKITVSRAAAPTTSLPHAQLMIAGRRQPIGVY